MCRFLDAGKYDTAHAQPTGVQKAPRHEVAGSWARAGQQALGGFDVGVELDGGRDTSATPSECLQGGEAGRVQWASRRALGAHQRAIGTLMDLIGSREIAIGMEPTHRTEKAATLTVGLPHEVSMLLGVGRHLGSQPRAITSITIIRAPQRGHGQGSTRGVSGAISGCFCGSAAGGATSSSARAVAMLSARLALAKSP